MEEHGFLYKLYQSDSTGKLDFIHKLTGDYMTGNIVDSCLVYIEELVFSGINFHGVSVTNNGFISGSLDSLYIDMTVEPYLMDINPNSRMSYPNDPRLNSYSRKWFFNLMFEDGIAKLDDVTTIKIPEIAHFGAHDEAYPWVVLEQKCHEVLCEVDISKKTYQNLLPEANLQGYNYTISRINIHNNYVDTYYGDIDDYGNGYGIIKENILLSGLYFGQIQNWRAHGQGLYINDFQKIEGEFDKGSLIKGKYSIHDSDGKELGYLEGRFDKWKDDGGSFDYSNDRHMDILLNEYLLPTNNISPVTMTAWCCGHLLNGLLGVDGSVEKKFIVE